MDFLFAKQLLPKPLEFDANGLVASKQPVSTSYPTKSDVANYPFEITYFFRLEKVFANNIEWVTDTYSGNSVRGVAIRRASDANAIIEIPSGVSSPYVTGKTAHYIAQMFRINADGTYTHGLYWNGWYGLSAPSTYNLGSYMRVYPGQLTAPYAVVYNRILTQSELDYLSKVYAYKNPIGG